MIVTKEMAETAMQEHYALQKQVSSKKYQLPEEHDFLDVKDRMIRFVLRKGKGIYEEHTIESIAESLRAGEIIPAGSILSGLDNPYKNASLSNCYMTPIEGDSLEHIFEAVKRLARTYSYRGGSGTDFTVLRPKNTAVNNAALTSTGSVSFLPIFDRVTHSIGQAGRRGALIVLLDIRHPDALDFIWAKARPEEVFGVDPLTGETPRITGANLSLKIPDAFMQAVEEDRNWDFIYPAIEVIQGNSVKPNSIDLLKPVFEALDPALGDHVYCLGHWFKVIGVNVEDCALVLDIGDHALHQGKVQFQYCRAADMVNGQATRYCKEVYSRLWTGDYNEWIVDHDQICLVYNTMPARQVLRQIAEASHAVGDPGIMFIDACQRNNPGAVIHPDLVPKGSNPCGEMPLPSNYANCMLISIPFHNFVKNPWSGAAEFDLTAFRQAVENAVLFQDLVVDENIHRHPLPQQREMDAFSRRIGVEPTGIADALAMLGMQYGSQDAVAWLEQVMKIKAQTEIKASLRLAKMRGCAPALEDKQARQRLLAHPFIEQLELGTSTRAEIVNYGLRHCAWSTAGPCGSISIMSDNCTSGIEPVFRFAYQRSTRLDGEGTTFELIHLPPLKYMLEHPELCLGRNSDELCRAFNYVCADEIPYLNRIRMQAAVQKYTDAGVSSTINLPCDAMVDTVFDIYVQAWRHQLKGITVFRDGCKKSVLTGNENKKAQPGAIQAVLSSPIERELLDVESAFRHRVMWSKTKLYIIVSVDEDGKPLEIFTKLPREAGINGDGFYSEALFQEKYSLWDTICRLASLLLRVGMPVERVINQMEKSSYSMVDAAGILARILRKYVQDDLDDVEAEQIVECGLGSECPSCHVKAYVHENGCGICKACGYTTCG